MSRRREGFDWQATRRTANKHPCPACGAAIGVVCRGNNGVTPIMYRPAHSQRVILTLDPPDIEPGDLIRRAEKIKDTK